MSQEWFSCKLQKNPTHISLRVMVLFFSYDKMSGVATSGAGQWLNNVIKNPDSLLSLSCSLPQDARWLHLWCICPFTSKKMGNGILCFVNFPCLTRRVNIFPKVPSRRLPFIFCSWEWVSSVSSCVGAILYFPLLLIFHQQVSAAHQSQENDIMMNA